MTPAPGQTWLLNALGARGRALQVLEVLSDGTLLVMVGRWQQSRREFHGVYGPFALPPGGWLITRYRLVEVRPAPRQHRYGRRMTDEDRAVVEALRTDRHEARCDCQVCTLNTRTTEDRA